MILPPGAKEPVRFRDWHAGYIPKADFDRQQSEWQTRKQMAERTLLDYARKLEQHAQAMTSRQSPAPDPLAGVADQQFIDGKTLVSLYQRMQHEGITPLLQWAQGANGVLSSLQKKLGQVETRVHQHDRRRADSEVQDFITKTLETAGLDAKHPLLRKQVENYYYSHESADGEGKPDARLTEIPTMFASDITALRKLFRDLDRADAEQKRKQLLPSKGGSVTPSGGRGYQHRSMGQIAKDLKSAGFFDSTQDT